MMVAPLPPNEARRLAALVSCAVLDTAPEPTYDHMAQLASIICETPIALVSLVDESRQWFKASVGLEAKETPRDVSFCAHAILADEPFIVPDTYLDPRFADNPLVTGAPFIRFYAGVPLMLEKGLSLGSLCVIDVQPRKLTDVQLTALQMLAKQVTSELSLRRKLRVNVAAALPAPSNGDTIRVDSYAPTMLEDEKAHGLLSRLPVSIGQVVDQRYRIDEVIGRGGMGVVTRCLDMHENRRVAIKFMLPEVVNNREALKRFVREAMALRVIRSKHVADLYDVGNLRDGNPFIVMEYLEGEDLASRLLREAPLPLEMAVDIALQACAGVEAAHEHGVLHRDLKPANLFLARSTGDSELVKVLDFGIAKLATPKISDSNITAAHTTIGSPQYMSPEQMTEPESVDRRADVWSLGVILYELLSGEPPFEAGSFPEVCARVLTSRAVPLSEVSSDLPTALTKVVQHCLERDRIYRYGTVSELMHALKQAAQSSGLLIRP